MWFRILLTGSVLGLVLYFQFFFDFKEAFKEKSSHEEPQYSIKK